MNTLYIFLIILFLVLSIFYYLKYHRIVKLNSDSNYKNENLILSNRINDLLKRNNEYESTAKSNIENLQNNISIKEQEIQNLKKELDTNITNYKNEILNLKEDFLIEKEKVFDKGIAKGKELSNYRIEIHPYQEIKQVKKILGSEDVLNIGYKYMMFINDTPTAYSHIEIFETVSKKEIDEEKVNKLISRISEISNLVPNGNVKLVGNIAEFGKNLLNFRK